MRRIKLLLAAPMLILMLSSAPNNVITAQAVKVDIKDNYDTGALGQEQDTEAERQMEAAEEAEANASDSASSGNAASTASSTANNAATTAASTTATSASTTPTSTQTASSTASTTPTAATTASTTTTDMPRTGDDNRIMITFTVMLASFSIFLTALMGERYSKKK